MTYRLPAFLLAGTLLLGSTGAGAITPENGLWWNSLEPGRGFTFDLQDNILGVTVFVYDAQGNPVFYQAVAELVDDYLFEGELHRFSGGQCITCAYTAPGVELGFAGPITIEFLSDSAALLTWKGGTIRIERQRFGILDDEISRMLGEWYIVMDFSAANDGFALYFGDVLRFTDIEVIQGIDEFVGFRPFTIPPFGDAAGTFEPGSGEHVIVVDEDTHWLAYFILVETDRLWGIVESYPKGTNPTGFGFPVQGFRSASASFVQTGAGPNKRATGRGVSAAHVLEGGGPGRVALAVLRPDADVARLLLLATQLQQRLATRPVPRD